MVWDSANTDSSGIFEPKVKAHSEEGLHSEDPHRRPPDDTAQVLKRGGV